MFLVNVLKGYQGIESSKVAGDRAEHNSSGISSILPKAKFYYWFNLAKTVPAAVGSLAAAGTAAVAGIPLLIPIQGP